jgi:hypothetical protein
MAKAYSDPLRDVVPAMIFGGALGLSCGMLMFLGICDSLFSYLRYGAVVSHFPRPANFAAVEAGAYFAVGLVMFIAAIMVAIRKARRRPWDHEYVKRGVWAGLFLASLVAIWCVYMHFAHPSGLW